MNLTMFERLQSLPLFQGLTIRELSEIVEWMKLDFHRLAEGSLLVAQGDRCDTLIYVMNGTVGAEHQDSQSRYIFSEIYEAPLVLEPYNMFGLNRHYLNSYRLMTEGSTLVIKKDTFNRLLANYHIIRTNMMNLVCTRMQKMESESRLFENKSVRRKIIDLIKTLSLSPKGKKLLQVKMEVLADMIGETRLNVSKELNTLCDEGRIKIKRGEIVVEALDDLD